MLRGKGVIGLALLGSVQVWAAEGEAIRLIVKYKTTGPALTSVQTQINQITGMTLVDNMPMANGAYNLILKNDHLSKSALKGETALDHALTSLRANPQVLYAVEDRVGHFKPLPVTAKEDMDDLLSHESQWDEFGAPGGVRLESAAGLRDGAWALTTGKAAKPIVVAVLDTGIEPNSNLIDNIVKDAKGNIFGWNFAGKNADVSDETGSYHGTHVAGTIAGYGPVAIGMGTDLKILPVKIPDASGMFYESQVVNGIYWAVGAEVPGTPINPYPASVMNMSFGVDAGPGKELDYCDEALQDALLYARKKGAVVAAAAGNDNRWEHYNAPGVCNATIKVASTGPEGLRAYYSNYGPGVTLAAPGGDTMRYGKKGGILSTVNPGGGYHNSGFDFYQGTSMASPHVAGVAALLFAVTEGHISPEKVEQILYTTTHDFGSSTNADRSCVGKKPCGHGILDAQSAVEAAQKGFDKFFTAPVAEKAGLASCHSGFQASSKTLAAGLWQSQGSVCQSAEAYQHPRIEQTPKGEIIAHYGAASYRFDQSRFGHCEVIGFDGIGCRY